MGLYIFYDFNQIKAADKKLKKIILSKIIILKIELVTYKIEGIFLFEYLNFLFRMIKK
jgi:hypothetical protein